LPTPPEDLGFSRFYRSADVAQFLVFCVVFCWPLFVLLVIVSCVIFRLSAAGYSFRVLIFSYPSHSAFSMPLSIFNSNLLFFISIMIFKHLSFYNNNLTKMRFEKNKCCCTVHSIKILAFHCMINIFLQIDFQCYIRHKLSYHTSQYY